MEPPPDAYEENLPEYISSDKVGSGESIPFFIDLLSAVDCNLVSTEAVPSATGAGCFVSGGTEIDLGVSDGDGAG